MTGRLDELAAGGDTSGQKNEHRDVQVLRSSVEVGKNVDATLFAEASQALGIATIRSFARTVAQVTKQSWRWLVVGMRQARNGALRDPGAPHGAQALRSAANAGTDRSAPGRSQRRARGVIGAFTGVRFFAIIRASASRRAASLPVTRT